MKKLAFTIAEIMLALTVIGILAALMLNTLKINTFSDKANMSNAYKAIDLFDQAAMSLRDVNSDFCPMGTFIYKSGKNSDGTNSYDIGVNATTSQQVFDAFATYIKFDKTVTNFCSYSGYCNASSTTYPGGKIGNIYIGVQLLSSLADCPEYNLPGTDERGNNIRVQINKKEIENVKPKCWAKLYIDTNGDEGPNTAGEDVFVFGFDEKGLHH